jgi:micrococcal nuclease
VAGLAVVLAALALGACSRAGSSGATNGASDRIVVTKEVDGDTIRVRVGGGAEERVRFIGVDTPETHGPGGLRECFGQEAARRTAELLPPGTEVRLVRDAEARDKYGRLLAYVYRARDGLFVNLSLAQDGFAAALTIPPNVAHADEFVKAAADARAAGRGLWGRCGGPDTPITQQAALHYRRGP